MAIIRAAKKVGGSKYMGFCEVAWVNVKDRINEKTDMGDVKFPWADVYIDIELKPKDSEYTRNMTICGSFDKDDSGRVKSDSTLLKRIYWFLDSINCQAGVNAKGEWEDEKGSSIEDIATYLKGYIKTDEVHDLFVYIYKEPDKKDPNKAWTRVHNHIVKNDASGHQELESYIAFMKNKGYLKEATDMPKTDPDVITVNSDEELHDLLSGMPE